MFQVWGQTADVMQVIMVAGLFIIQLGIYCFFGEELHYQVGYRKFSTKQGRICSMSEQFWFLN